MNHNWSGWPGAYCLNCGIDDPIEDALACEKCLDGMVPDPQYGLPILGKLCAEHEKLVTIPCVLATNPPSEV